MKQSVAILGRQPAISLAELESLLGSEKIITISNNCALLDIPCQNIPFERLGGVIKLGEVICCTNISQLSKTLLNIVEHLILLKQSKINIGLSAYNLSLDPKTINKLAMSLKKQLKTLGLSARTIPNRQIALNTAQVLHNRLLGERGFELLLIGLNNNVYIAKTTNLQDINSYTIRDRGRPKRDSKIGMLPPKLAQIIINLAVGTQKPNKNYLLDPFCGTGVILQEALLMGYNAVGSDINPRMIEYSTTNLNWLIKEYPIKAKFDLNVGVSNATTTTWNRPIFTVATETYLGPVFYQPPSVDHLTSIINELNILHKKFLLNLSKQIPSGTKVCLAVPAWSVKGKFYHLPTLDQLPKLGYNRLAFKYANSDQLIYHRPDQMVARELVVLIKE